MIKNRKSSEFVQGNKNSLPKRKSTPQHEREKKVKVEQSQQVANGIRWLAFLFGFYLVTRSIRRLFLRRPSKTGLTEMQTEKTPHAMKGEPMGKRAKWYMRINTFVSVIALYILLLDIYDLHQIEKLDESARDPARGLFAGGLLVCYFGMFLSRAIWMWIVQKRGYQIADNPDDYAMERTTLFAWGLLTIMALYRMFSGTLPSEVNLSPVETGIVVLACWTPFMSIVGSSWGKLKATSLNGDKIIWPRNWGKSSVVKRSRHCS